MGTKQTIKLGMEVQDRVTGFHGIAVSIATYLSGCDRVLVQPKMKKEGEFPEPEHFDITDLEIIGNGIYTPPAPIRKRTTGGPRPFPGRIR